MSKLLHAYAIKFGYTRLDVQYHFYNDLMLAQILTDTGLLLFETAWLKPDVVEALLKRQLELCL